LFLEKRDGENIGIGVNVATSIFFRVPLSIT